MAIPDVVIVGAGIVGLATAYQLLRDDPTLRVTVIDKEDTVGAHQSSHNSGVLHSGVYYRPGSLKAKLTREGKPELERFAEEHGIPVVRNGKVIVAVDESERGRLADLAARARANEVPGLRELGPEELAELEPHVRGVAALHSPSTASTDFLRVCEALAHEVRQRDGQLLLGTEIVGVREGSSQVELQTTGPSLTTRVVATCAGLDSDRVASMTAAPPDPRIVPFMGSWLVLRPEARHLVRGHVYPVPDPRLPFLGVHLSRRVDGSVWIGPNAILAPGRESYDRSFDGADLRDVLAYPGFWRLAAQHAVTGARELWLDRVRSAYLRQVRRYVPEVGDDDVEAERPNGIRAQAVSRSGELLDDFAIDRTPRVVHVRNAPSPGATSSLAVGRLIAGEVLERLNGDRG